MLIFCVYSYFLQISSQLKATSQYASSQRSGLSSLSRVIGEEKIRQDTVVEELQESLRQATERQEQLKMVSMWIVAHIGYSLTVFLLFCLATAPVCDD